MNKDPNIDRLLSNRYRLIDLVGEGAMGRVYRAKDTLLGDVIVAVKFLAQSLLNQKMRDRFEQEATICALLGEISNHIVRVRDYGVDSRDGKRKIPFYVMEFLEGESLDEIIKYEGVCLSRFINLTRQICLGLHCAHEGIMFKGQRCPIVHRDIKPSNILVVSDPTLDEWVKILDFGIAKLNRGDQNQTYSFMGTLAYCSPEQMEGKELDNRSDIYSLGIMMYEMLTCDLPVLPESSSFGSWYVAHHETKPKAFRKDLEIPKNLEKLIFKCLAKKPRNRPKNVGEILEILERLESDLQAPNPSIVPSQPVVEQIKDEVPATEFTAPQPEPTRVSAPPADRSSLYIAKTGIQHSPEIEKICSQTTWPENKPKEKIVFPKVLDSPVGKIPSLFVMLDLMDLLDRKNSTRYNQFLFLKSPHPMVLWLTVLYNRRHGPRWLPCYLDLKRSSGRTVIETLAETGCYQILLFAVNDPNQCQKVLSSTIAPDQCLAFKDWADYSKIARGPDLAKMSKQLLKQEYEKLKHKITLKLEAVNH
ncbi:MAG: serine/threonine-protein kinase [Prochloraceae cyanobacterium]|nr:serine/threonine-protein kinase [Prochloraceae cyanobacterium]